MPASQQDKHRLRCASVAIVTALLLTATCTSAAGEISPVTAEIEIVKAGTPSQASEKRSKDASNVAVWLTPMDLESRAAVGSIPEKAAPQLVQRNKTFEPHVLIVKVGTVVEFPNRDPFFHNIFSLFDGKRFDLGLYASGTTRTVKFDRPGISFLFCNIHAEMSAIVLAVETPYFGVSSATGFVSIHGVPNGHYELHVWYERSSPESLKTLIHEVAISDSDRSLNHIRVVEDPKYTSEHKNKYGMDYEPVPDQGYSKR